MSKDQRIQDNAYWVLPEKLLGVRKPESIKEVQTLKDMGVTGIITLLDDHENHELYQSQEMSFLHIPIKGGTAPTKEDVFKSTEYFESLRKRNEALAIHCSGGKKRTGTLIVGILISQGFNFDQAMEKLNHANPEIKLSEVQMTFLRNLGKDQ